MYLKLNNTINCEAMSNLFFMVKFNFLHKKPMEHIQQDLKHHIIISFLLYQLIY